VSTEKSEIETPEETNTPSSSSVQS
jgi:hypothetical protein